MNGLFKVLGVGVAVYAVYAAITGTVHAKSGVRFRTVARRESPLYFWIVTGIYAGLAIALMTIF